MADTHQDALDGLELERKRLENDKLRAEIADGNLSWWKRPGYLAGSSPILIALAGVFAAWVSGYFDTQREKLANDIAALEKEKAALSADIEKAQMTLDLAYLRIRLGADDAQYALGHFNAYSAETTEYTQYIIENWDSLPENIQPQMNGLFDLLADRFNIVQITQDSLVELSGRLDKIETSPWTKTLTSDPMLSQNGLLRDPDGNYFDVGEGRFLTQSEADARLSAFGRPVSDD